MRSVLNRALVLFLPLLVIAAAVSAADGPDLKSGVFDPPRLAPDFSLQGSHGSEFKLSQYRGKVIVLGFGYTSCPDVCPTTLAVLAQARKKLGAIGNELQVVYVTVDPERDNALQLRQYLAAFDPTFIGGTGTIEQLAGVRRAYGIVATKKPLEGKQSGYLVHHSSFLYLIDREGSLRALMPYGRTADDFAHDVKILLNK
jgi:protein SCO1/2